MSIANHFENIVISYIKAQERSRYWHLLFRSLWLVFIIAIVAVIFIQYNQSKNFLNKDHVALIKLDGIIASDNNVNAERINKSLTVAFKNKSTKAVILRINSPGGSPVESDEIYQQMRYLSKKYPQVPLYAICTDICASGGYYVASAAKNIYANAMTITGSIGVRAGGLGFVELINKIGIERRLYTAGKDKAFLDPFQIQNPTQIADMKKILIEAHEVFINAIKNGRGKRLNIKYEDKIFSGVPLSGIQAKKYGLIDEFGSITSIIENKLKGLPIVNYTQPLNMIDKISSKFGSEFSYKAEQLSKLKLQ